MTKVKEKKRKLILVGVTFGLCITIMLSGTFAWQSLSQTAKNEAMGGIKNPGGRLHDDFNGSNKDIYVENFMKENEGQPIIVRIRLFEHMEIGENAGNETNREGVRVLTKDADGKDSVLGSVSTWHLHKYGEENTTTEENPHTYWTWQMGGQTTYMPTFNKNKDSNKADINGTYAGSDGKTDAGTPYDDYKDYTLDAYEKMTGDEVYDDDANDIDDDGTYTIKGVEHAAKPTLNADVISIVEWLALDDSLKLGNYWVYDEDGWAYWANPLGPEEATGLLLDKIILGSINEKWYYGIYVECEMVTADEIVDASTAKATERGFYHNHAHPEDDDETCQPNDGCPSPIVQEFLLTRIIEEIGDISSGTGSGEGTGDGDNGLSETSLDETDASLNTILKSDEDELEETLTESDEIGENDENTDEEETDESEKTDENTDGETDAETQEPGQDTSNGEENGSGTTGDGLNGEGEAGDNINENEQTGNDTTSGGTSENTPTDKETTEDDTTVDDPDETETPKTPATETPEGDLAPNGISEELETTIDPESTN